MVRHPLPTLLAGLTTFILTGCNLVTTATPSPEAGASIRGKIHGGQQPVVGAHVYLFAANTTGYGGSGIAPSALNASLSLLNPVSTGNADAIGAYVLTAGDGSFTLNNDYACAPNSQVYLYALGGNPGAGINSSAGFLSAVGNCPTGGSFPSTQFVWVNEVSTIAAAYAFAGFASDATHISSSGTALAQTGIANAFANAANLASSSTGTALATTPAGNGIVPQAEINTLANILASCVNSTGKSTGPSNPTPCYTLFTNTPSAGSAIIPTDTATAAINIAHSPATNVVALYGIPPPAVAFAPTLSPQPNDFTILLGFTGAGLGFNSAIAIDATGNAWVANGTANGSVVKLSPAGAILSGASGFSDGFQSGTLGIAIDLSGNAWIASDFSNTVTKFSSSGAVLTGNNGFPALYSLGGPWSVAIDAQNDAWIAETTVEPVVKYSSGGILLSQPAGYAGTTHVPRAVQVDGAGSVWEANFSGPYVTKFSGSSATLSGANGFKGGGIAQPHGLTIDSSGNVWVVSQYSSASIPGGLTKLSNTGSVLVAANPSQNGTSAFLQHPWEIAVDGAGSVWITDRDSPGSSIVELSNSAGLLSPVNGFCSGQLSLPIGIAPDGSGNVWIADEGGSVFELVGAATPVITPIAAGLPLIPTLDGSSNLGTRP